jgi:indole-3-glycerol phosphate synthase
LKTLKELAEGAAETVRSGYYAKLPPSAGKTSRSLVRSISSREKTAIVCEIKFSSPSAGKIDARYDQVAMIAKQMELGGAAGLSVLTEPKSFNGSLSNLVTAKNSTDLPVIMKDIVVSKEQIRAASNVEASAVLLILEVFAENYAMEGLTLRDAISAAKKIGLEVIVETHTKEGLKEAAKLDCDIIGINNRDLNTFKTSIDTTIDLLGGVSLQNGLIMSESGYETANDISYVNEKLKESGAPIPRAFLIGTSIMKSADVQAKVREFVEQGSYTVVHS